MRLDDLDAQLKLIALFKEKKPNTFFDAFQIALSSGIVVQKIIVDALEVYSAERAFIRSRKSKTN